MHVNNCQPPPPPSFGIKGFIRLRVYTGSSSLVAAAWQRRPPTPLPPYRWPIDYGKQQSSPLIPPPSLLFSFPSPQDFQGAAECALAQVVGGRDQTWVGLLSGGAKTKGSAPAKVIIRAEEVANSNSLVDLTLAGSNLG